MTAQTGMKAIQTPYKGFLFRSRLEARYAVFFDALSLKWEYEKEGYNLGELKWDFDIPPDAPTGDVWYLPDFWLPELSMWVEVKGKPAGDVECEKCGRLCWLTHSDVLLMVGDAGNFDVRDEWISLMPHTLYRWVRIEKWTAECMRNDPDEYGGKDKVDEMLKNSGCSSRGEPIMSLYDLAEIFKRDVVYIENAIAAMRAARFEFGETPTLRNID